MFHNLLAPARAVVFGLLAAQLSLGVSATLQGAESAPGVVPLASVDQWQAESASARSNSGAVEFELTVNYPIARVVSPPIDAKPGELFTLAAELTTEFPANQAAFYRFWLTLEFLEGKRVVGAASSQEVVGAQKEERLVAVTGQVPAEATHVRAVLHGQNKYWNPLKNQAVLRDLRLLRLSGRPGGSPQLKIAKPLPKTAAARSCLLEARSDWPDGTALQLRATRGHIPLSVILTDGRAEFEVKWAAEEVGSTSVTATVAEQSATTEVPDPYAGRLSIEQFLADGSSTPALVRLTRDGMMLPGRYQLSTPGIFATPPYTVDLSPGTWQLEIVRGPQFEPFRKELEIVSGKTQRFAQVDLKRRVDLREKGWYGGDADGDVYHGERIYTDVNAQTAADVAQAMGLDWVGVGSWGIKPKNWAEARAHMRSLGTSELLFMWTDERPKTKQGHACFLGLDGPDNARLGWAWSGPKRPMDNFETLQAIRAHGGATFVNQPLRWWMKGDRFNTNMYSTLPFDLCAAAALDGFNINEREDDLKVWSMLLDHGYRVAATAGADFSLDRPNGPVPGKARMYCYCPDGLSIQALADAVRRGHTVVSTGPVLIADVDGLPPGSEVSPAPSHKIRAQVWAAGDRDDPLVRVELWAHGEVTETRKVEGDQATVEFDWKPKDDADWVAVRAISKRGWAMTSAFTTQSEAWQPKRPLDCKLTVQLHGLSDQEISQAKLEVWDRATALPGAKPIQRHAGDAKSLLTVPVTSALVVRVPKRPVQEVNVFDALGVREILDRIASGQQREQPLLEWSTYEQVLDRCNAATLDIRYSSEGS